MSYKFNPFTGNFDQVGSVSSVGPQGAIQFSDGSGGFAADATNLIWDDVNNRLQIGPISGSSSLNLSGSVNPLSIFANAGSQLYINLSDNSSYTHFIGAEDSSGTGLFGSGIPNALAIGTTAAQAITFHTNNDTTPRLIISSSGVITTNNNINLNSNKVVNLADPTSAQDAATKNYVDTNFIPLSQKGAALGVATLDANQKVPVQQLPNSIMQYIGTWNASTNTPILADGVGNPDEAIGDVYRVTVAGTQNLGSGSQTFKVGDYVILNDNKIWEQADTTDPVPVAEQRTITLAEETATSLTLAQTPIVPNTVLLLVSGAPAQIYGLDYTVSGNILSWTGLGLDGLLQENDEVSILYTI